MCDKNCYSSCCTSYITCPPRKCTPTITLCPPQKQFCCPQPQQCCPQPVCCPQPQQFCCPTPCPTPCSDVVYITEIPVAVVIPSGGIAIPTGTIIPAGTTTLPVGTLTLINGYGISPITNLGGITLNNGFFTVPVAGKYSLTTDVVFQPTSTVVPTDLRELFIYRIAAGTGVTTLLAVDTRVPVAGNPTAVNVSTGAYLNAGDRIFIAARQISAGAVSISTVPNSGRVAILKV